MKWKRDIYATPAQEAYIRRLRAEVAPLGTAKWAASKRQLLKSEASIEIDMLKAAIEEGKRLRADAEQV